MSPERVRHYETHMRRCIDLARTAAGRLDIPVGALVLDEGGNIIGTGFNTREHDHDPAGHAEIVALREAALSKMSWRLDGCTLVVTLEPCTMCAGAIVLSRVATIVFGAWDPKAGAAGSVRDVLRDPRLNHQVEVIGGVLEEECSAQLAEYFRARR
ncbi:tRNA adenosine(34) deaminase TadA [Flaviflexus huanghaiensis]|uniref:tRNA adenosine(34) deaminase TadA n=1 Tax=Flaviflexus huanghaiensis TaxID=1111473 RepID=UPI0015FD762F|nr:tRNA adenosine(34) deaminase TadA [Flaviflexus huanghaiensis]